jgi:hypothetical protein
MSREKWEGWVSLYKGGKPFTGPDRDNHADLYDALMWANSRIRELEKELNTCPICGGKHRFCTRDMDAMREEIARLRDAVRWAENVDDYCSAGQGVDYAFIRELRKRAGMEE